MSIRKPSPVPEHMKTKIVAVVAEGDLVVVVTPHELPNPKDPSATYTTAWFDMWRFKNGKADEHWDGSDDFSTSARQVQLDPSRHTYRVFSGVSSAAKGTNRAVGRLASWNNLTVTGRESSIVSSATTPPEL